MSKILIASDDRQHGALLDAYLADEGYELEIVHDGREALDSVAKSKPDLILLDITAPKLSGYEVCQRLKSNPETRGISVIIVTATTETRDIEQAVAAGANDFLAKPVNRLELKARVRTLVELGRSKSQPDDFGS